jgi:hypothetical protein
MRRCREPTSSQILRSYDFIGFAVYGAAASSRGGAGAKQAAAEAGPLPDGGIISAIRRRGAITRRVLCALVFSLHADRGRSDARLRTRPKH